MGRGAINDLRAPYPLWPPDPSGRPDDGIGASLACGAGAQQPCGRMGGAPSHALPCLGLCHTTQDPMRTRRGGGPLQGRALVARRARCPAPTVEGNPDLFAAFAAVWRHLHAWRAAVLGARAAGSRRLALCASAGATAGGRPRAADTPMVFVPAFRRGSSTGAALDSACPFICGALHGSCSVVGSLHLSDLPPLHASAWVRHSTTGLAVGFKFRCHVLIALSVVRRRCYGSESISRCRRSGARLWAAG